MSTTQQASGKRSRSMYCKRFVDMFPILYGHTAPRGAAQRHAAANLHISHGKNSLCCAGNETLRCEGKGERRDAKQNGRRGKGAKQGADGGAGMRKEGGRRGGDDARLEKGCLGLDDENLGAERAYPRLERVNPFLAKAPLFLESSPRYIARAYPFFPKKAPWLHPKTGGYGTERGLTTQRASPWGESALRCKVCAPWGAGYVSQW